MLGQFIWFDLNTHAAKTSTAFYEAVVGWTTQVWEEAEYTMFAAPDEMTVGGVQELGTEDVTAGAPDHWIAYVSVEDVDATAAQVPRLGGRVLQPPTDIPGIGRFCVIADPWGTAVAPMTPNSAMTSPHPPPVGHCAWFDLLCPDPKAALAFYGALFGWTQRGEMPSPNGIYSMVGHPSVPTMLGGLGTNAAPEPAQWRFYFRVASLDAALQAVTDLGGRVTMGPMTVPSGDRVAHGLDPEGAPFALHEQRA